MSRLYLLLGRTGDIINLLPLLWKDHQDTGEAARLMVAKEFAPLLEGCSYVEPVVYDGSFMEIEQACAVAEHTTDDLRVGQLTGPRNAVLEKVYKRAGLKEGQPEPESFCKQSWNLCGRLGEWRNQYPLVFDRRNHVREAALVAKHIPKNKKKNILVSLESVSSPFEHRLLAMEIIKLKYGKTHNIIDLSQIKCERFYDLLALYEKAFCIVAIDSAPLHLAYAVRVPVVALIQDKPSLFFGSPWRPNHVFHCRYSDFTKRAGQMVQAMECIGLKGDWFANDTKMTRFVHVWSHYDLTEENRSRHDDAKRGWKKMYQEDGWVACPVEIGSVGRDSVTVFKDEFRYPYVKDVIRNACLRAEPDDAICLTRCDDDFVLGTPMKLATSYPCWSHRFKKETPWMHTPVDLFCFTKKWWVENQGEYPDMIMGTDQQWGRVLMELIKLKGGKEIAGVITRAPGTEQRIKLTAYRGLNATLAKGWMDKHGITDDQPKVSNQVTTKFVNNKALNRFGYNPSMLAYDGRLWMAYRWHHRQNMKSTIVMAELDKDFNVLQNLPIDGMNDFEDPRLFVHMGRLWMSFVKSLYPEKPNCAVVYGQLHWNGNRWALVSSYQPQYGKNDMTAMEKNWVFWSHKNILMSLYHSAGEQVVLELQGEQVLNTHRSPGLEWKFGEPHGGAIVPWRGKLLRLFHSRMMNEPAPIVWRYYMGACLMEPEPPFKIVAVSKEPILRGSENDDLPDKEQRECFHRKVNVVFPAGAVLRVEDILVSVGVNDCACGIIRLTEKDLKL